MPAPAGLTLAIGGNLLEITWDAVADATGYELQIDAKHKRDANYQNNILDFGVFSRHTRRTTISRGTFPLSKLIAIQVRIRVRALFNESKSDFSAYQGVEWEGTTGGTSQSAEEEVQGAIAAAGANAETGARIEIDDFYSHIEQPPVSAAISPVFNGHIPTLCWRTATTIPAYSLPDIVGGLPPYSVTATGLPAGVRLDGLTLTGSPYDAAPLGGVATFTLTDANGNTDIRMMDWVVAMGAPAGWSEIGGGFGTESNPFEIPCALTGNIRPTLFRTGATNAADIAANTGSARAVTTWFKCPTTLPHIARLRGAASPDYDLVIKVGSAYHFSDTPDDFEMVEVGGHTDGALIGIYRYAETTTTSGANSAGDPLVLEWFPLPQYLPTEPQGVIGHVGGAVGEVFAQNAPTVPGFAETDVYVLYRTGSTGAWVRNGTPLVAGWNDIGLAVKEIRFEVHLKKWENRALRRFTTYHRDRE